MVKLTRDEIGRVLNAYTRSPMKDDQDVQAVNDALNAIMMTRAHIPQSIAVEGERVYVIATDGSMWATGNDGMRWWSLNDLPAPEPAP